MSLSVLDSESEGLSVQLSADRGDGHFVDLRFRRGAQRCDAGPRRLRGVVWFGGIAEDTEDALELGRLCPAAYAAFEVCDDLNILVVFEQRAVRRGRVVARPHRDPSCTSTSFGSATIGVRSLYGANSCLDDLGVRRHSPRRGTNTQPGAFPGYGLVAQRFEDLLRENNAPTEKRRVRVACCPRWS